MTVILSERSESKDLRLYFEIMAWFYSPPRAEKLCFVTGHGFSRAARLPIEVLGLLAPERM
jgi:hypothetical protein